MRVFIALDLPQKTKDNLERSANEFKMLSNGGNFIPKDNYHLTLHFLGEVAPSDLTFIQSAMDGVKDLVAPELAVMQFTVLRASDVVCAKLRQSKDLTTLHDELGARLEQHGFEVEHRAYRPHVTLIRKKSFTLPFSEVTKSVRVYNMPFTACDLTLFESVFTPNGVTYRELYKVVLK
ncbi:MAG: RNA 2',3'-cyclic phosphodiesterase [Clostridiales bacterium]|nr:RNA 2',3'-cyclic phosphodiesterase [Clostridiales bacterium]